MVKIFNKLDKMNKKRRKNKKRFKKERKEEIKQKRADGTMGDYVEEVDRSINNLYTGLKPAGRTKGLILGGAVLNTAYQIGNIDSISNSRYTDATVAEQIETEEIQNLPSTFGDGSDYMSRMRDMQEQSDLAFAMHKLRGGRF